MENKTEFLQKLKQLTLKYGIIVDGCGCCGSPFLNEIDSKSQSDYFYRCEDEYDIVWSDPTG